MRFDTAAFSRPHRERVCAALGTYPRSSKLSMAFEAGEISPLCRPSVGNRRSRLDRCGDPTADPYVKEAGSQSKFTWKSGYQLRKQGKVNIVTDPGTEGLRGSLLSRVEELRAVSRAFCCQGDTRCESDFDRIGVRICEPSSDPNAPDPCAFGGTFRVPGRTYFDAFFQLSQATGKDDPINEIRRLAENNLRGRLRTAGSSTAAESIGSIVLTSYIAPEGGIDRLEPVILHEFGHACTIIRMRNWALDVHENSPRALRAAQWLDGARRRCEKDLELPAAYDDFWLALGETKELSSCLREIATANRDGRVDRRCSEICPGHYLEEASGIAFSLLTGDLSGSAASVFPNTCDHVRDAQHPMVSDVVDCLAQHSSRFRERLNKAYQCR